MKLLSKLTKKELLDLINVYSEYVINFYDEHDKEDTPVCINEFYEHEYALILDEE